MRTKSITTQDPAQITGMAYQYTYDKMDNILSKDTEHGSYVYGYDDVYRLISADNPASDDESYTYDSVGNRLTSTSYNDWQYNSNNELLTYNSVSFEYDSNGNITQKTEGIEVMNFIYDVDNRLVRAEDDTDSIIAEYYYDPFGRRIFKEVGGTRTYFFYSDEGLVGEYDATGIEIKTYGYKPDSNWTTDPVFMKENDNYYFYHNDHLGTPMVMIDINGNIVWSAIYDSFGEADVQPSSTIENNLRFPGQYYDTETGLHYNWHRYYDPEIGRYLRVDPIGFINVGVNLYRYVRNNPVILIDPYGLKIIYGGRDKQTLMDMVDELRKNPVMTDKIQYLDQISQEVKISDLAGWYSPATGTDYGFIDWLFNEPYPGSNIYIDLKKAPLFIKNMLPHIADYGCQKYSDEELNYIINTIVLAHELIHAYNAARDIGEYFWTSTAARERNAQFYERLIFHHYRLPSRYEKLP